MDPYGNFEVQIHISGSHFGHISDINGSLNFVLQGASANVYIVAGSFQKPARWPNLPLGVGSRFLLPAGNLLPPALSWCIHPLGCFLYSRHSIP